MRTILQLDNALVAEAKLLAARTGRNLSPVIEDALWQTMVPRPRERRVPVVLPTGPGGPRVGVDLDDGVALRDLMDEV